MNTALYENNIFEIKNLEAQVRELNEKIEVLKNQMKSDMEANGVDMVSTMMGVVRYQEVVSNRFDTSAFKKIDPKTYEKFLVASVSKRFTIK